jgi:hypothetical protein
MDLMSIKSVAKRNEAFKKMSKAQQCVAIARDVVAQIKAKKYSAMPGTYFDFHSEDVTWDWKALQKLLSPKRAPVCEVCAVGAAFASCARLGDDTFDSNYHEKLLDSFDARSIVLMECAFEQHDLLSFPTNASTLEERTKAMNFGDEHDDADERLVAIFKNVIKNKGEFKP